MAGRRSTARGKRSGPRIGAAPPVIVGGPLSPSRGDLAAQAAQSRRVTASAQGQFKWGAPSGASVPATMPSTRGDSSRRAGGSSAGGSRGWGGGGANAATAPPPNLLGALRSNMGGRANDAELSAGATASAAFDGKPPASAAPPPPPPSRRAGSLLASYGDRKPYQPTASTLAPSKATHGGVRGPPPVSYFGPRGAPHTPITTNGGPNGGFGSDRGPRRGNDRDREPRETRELGGWERESRPSRGAFFSGERRADRGRGGATHAHSDRDRDGRPGRSRDSDRDREWDRHRHSSDRRGGDAGSERGFRDQRDGSDRGGHRSWGDRPRRGGEHESHDAAARAPRTLSGWRGRSSGGVGAKGNDAGPAPASRGNRSLPPNGRADGADSQQRRSWRREEDGGRAAHGSGSSASVGAAAQGSGWGASSRTSAGHRSGGSNSGYSGNGGTRHSPPGPREHGTGRPEARRFTRHGERGAEAPAARQDAPHRNRTTAKDSAASGAAAAAAAAAVDDDSWSDESPAAAPAPAPAPAPASQPAARPTVTAPAAPAPGLVGRAGGPGAAASLPAPSPVVTSSGAGGGTAAAAPPGLAHAAPFASPLVAPGGGFPGMAAPAVGVAPTPSPLGAHHGTPAFGAASGMPMPMPGGAGGVWGVGVPPHGGRGLPVPGGGVPFAAAALMPPSATTLGWGHHPQAPLPAVHAGMQPPHAQPAMRGRMRRPSDDDVDGAFAARRRTSSLFSPDDASSADRHRGTVVAVDTVCGTIQWRSQTGATTSVTYNVQEVEGSVRPKVGDAVDFTFEQLPFASRASRADWGAGASELRAVGVTVVPTQSAGSVQPDRSSASAAASGIDAAAMHGGARW